jgi:hypothetical protein
MPLKFSNHLTDFFFFPQLFFGNVGVYLRRFAALMPEQILYVSQVRAFLQEVCGKGMAQRACSRQRADARPLR